MSVTCGAEYNVVEICIRTKELGWALELALVSRLELGSELG